jgi:PAS domain S-box-containing protein
METAQEIHDNVISQLAAVIDNLHEAILCVNTQGRISLFNKGAELIFGYSAIEMLGEPLTRLLPERFAHAHPGHMQRFAQSDENSRHMSNRAGVWGRRKDGSEFPAEASISKLQIADDIVFTVSLRDITERKLAEDNLQRLGRVLENTTNEIYIFDAQTLKFVQVNQGAQQNLGYNMAELQDMTPLDIKPTYTRAEFDRLLEKLHTQAEQRIVFETVHRRKDGSLYPVEVRLQYAKAEITPIYVAIIADISERREAEQLQARLTTIIESSTDIIGTADTDGNMLYLNQAGRRFIGLDQADAISGLRIADFHRGWALSQIMYESIPYAKRDGSCLSETELCNHAGEMIRVSQLILAHKDKHGKLCYLSYVMRDISETKLAEEQLLQNNRELKGAYQRLEQTQSQLLQSEKMASIGQLAAGVAHEINNPVGYISSNLGSLKNYMDDLWRLLDAYAAAEPGIADASLRAQLLALKAELDIAFLREDIDQLLIQSTDGVHRVKQIVKDLKDFSHVDETEWLWADLRKGLDSTLNIVWNELKYKANVIKEYGAIPDVECIASQLNQVFMNLLVNAAHAIEEHGTITLRTGTAGNDVFVEITDTGKGMPPEVQKRIFEPFYTTKPVGKGTGLGLSLAYGIVQKHHGQIIVHSEVGQGTTFRLILPIHRVTQANDKTGTSST